MKAILRAIAGRCPIHDRPTPYMIAELERDTGIDPHAVDKLWDQLDLAGAFCDTRLIDCGRARCQKRNQ